MTQAPEFVGVDIAKFEFCVFMSGERNTFSLPNTDAGHAELIKRLAGRGNLRIALEPTGGCEWALWERLDAAGFDVRQVSAAHVRSFARSKGNQAKTDPIDARLIADFLAFRPDAGRRLPAGILRRVNALTTKRRQLVDMRKTLKCQTRQRVPEVIDDMDKTHMALLKDQITTLEAHIKDLLQSDEGLNQRARILLSIPGVGPVVTAALIGQMPELGCLNDKQAAALVGLAPFNRDSGKYAGKRRIKGGREWVRRLLYQAAFSASRYNPALTVFAKRLKEKGKPHKLVMIAVARKLIIIANALIAKNAHWKQI